MNNTADRLLGLIKSIQATQSDNRKTAAIQYWPSVLETAYKQDSWDEQAVTHALLSAQDQIILLHTELLEKRVPERIFADYLQNINAALSPLLLSTAWSATKSKFDGTCVDIVEWATIVLGIQESPLSEDDLSTLTEQVSELKELADSESLPVSLKRLLSRQANELSRALADYPIKGIEPIQKAVKTISGDVVADQEPLKEASDSKSDEQKTAVHTLHSAVAKVADIVDRTAKTGGSVAVIWKLTSSAWKAITST